MKVRPIRLWASTVVAALVATCVVAVTAPSGMSLAAPNVQITLLNINDFHGRIDTNTVKFAGTIEKLRAEAPGGEAAVAVLSAGDNIGASLFASAVDDDRPTIDVLNALEFDASAVGNHEFDRGWTDFQSRILTPGHPDAAAFPYLGANVYAKGTTNPVMDEYAIIDLTVPNPGGGTLPVKVGVIGVVTAETPTLVSPAGVATLDFGNPVEAVNRVAAQLTDGNAANGEADVIVAEFHEGAGAGTPDGSTLEQEVAGGGIFAAIVTQTSAAVDVIFTGHTHKEYAWQAPVPGQPGATRPIVQTGSYGERIGKVVLTIDHGAAGKPVVASTAENVARVTTADADLKTAYPRVATVGGIVDAALANATLVGSQPVGAVSASITTAFSGGAYTGGVYTGGNRDDRSKESTLGNLVADSLVATLSSAERGGAEIGVVNPGGLRNELLATPDPTITYAEANAVLPFVNNLNTITLTGAQFKTLLEQQWQRLPNGTVPGRPYLQLGLSSNVSYTFDPTLPEGSRITSITVGGQPIDMARGYRIGSFSFLIEGGDNFHVFKQGTDKRDSGLIDRDAWIAYLTANNPVSPSFARRAVEVHPHPGAVTPGAPLGFTVKQLDLTSLGSPQNTTLEVKIGDTVIGSVPVTDGQATVNLTVPAMTSGPRTMTLTASPSGTVVSFPTIVADVVEPVTPTRLFDTRPGESPNALRTVPKAKVGPPNVLEVKVTELTGLVPASGVGAVSLNVTAVDPAGAGFITVYPCGTRRLVSSLNYGAGETVANAVIAPVSATGTVCFYSMSPVDIVVDVNGWLPTGTVFTAVAPDRVFDTRAGESPDALRTVAKAKVGPPGVLEVTITDLPGAVPASGVGAVSLNVVATNTTRAGFVTVYPCGTRTLVSSLNYGVGDTIANAVITPVSPTGTVCFYSNTPVDLVVDVNGWFAAGAQYNPVGPSRLVDTRPGESPDAVLTVPKAKIGPTNTLDVKVTGLAGLVPATGVGAVSLNVVATNATSAGFITVYPCGTRPFASNVNFTAGQTIANAVMAPVSADGHVCFYSMAPVDIVVDVNGWVASS